MLIAVTYEDGMVFQHFGHSEQFKLYEVEDGKVVRSGILGAQGSGHSALAALLQNYQVDTLICGGIGGGAVQALTMAGIHLYPGVEGSADQAVLDLLGGRLSDSAEPSCGCHEEGHECGHDSCGEDQGCGGNCADDSCCGGHCAE